MATPIEARRDDGRRPRSGEAVTRYCHAVSLRWDEPSADPHLFYEWLASACEHGPFGRLVSHRLGYITRIAFLRNLFLNAPDRFPTLLSKVVYDGAHCCDMLSLSDVENVADEMLAVHSLHCADASYEAILRDFEECMAELVQVARTFRRPIVFE